MPSVAVVDRFLSDVGLHTCFDLFDTDGSCRCTDLKYVLTCLSFATNDLNWFDSFDLVILVTQDMNRFKSDNSDQSSIQQNKRPLLVSRWCQQHRPFHRERQRKPVNANIDTETISKQICRTHFTSIRPS